MARIRAAAKPIFINPLEDAHPHEIRAMRERASKRIMRETLHRLRESSASVDSAVSTAADAVESALAENPHDSDLVQLQKALQRYQAATDAAADLVNAGGDTDDSDDEDGAE